jgi:hypothetical protein
MITHQTGETTIMDIQQDLTPVQVDDLYEYINAPTTIVKFIHSSLMTEPEEIEYILLKGIWRPLYSVDAANPTFKQDEIYSPFYWA